MPGFDTFHKVTTTLGLSVMTKGRCWYMHATRRMRAEPPCASCFQMHLLHGPLMSQGLLITLLLALAKMTIHLSRRVSWKGLGFFVIGVLLGNTPTSEMSSKQSPGFSVECPLCNPHFKFMTLSPIPPFHCVSLGICFFLVFWLPAPEWLKHWPG